MSSPSLPWHTQDLHGEATGVDAHIGASALHTLCYGLIDDQLINYAPGLRIPIMRTQLRHTKPPTLIVPPTAQPDVDVLYDMCFNAPRANAKEATRRFQLRRQFNLAITFSKLDYDAIMNRHEAHEAGEPIPASDEESNFNKAKEIPGEVASPPRQSKNILNDAPIPPIASRVRSASFERAVAEDDVRSTCSLTLI